MQGHKWPESVQSAALDILAQAAQMGMTVTAACDEVVTRLDPAPSIHTLRWWPTPTTCSPRRLNSGRHPITAARTMPKENST